MERATMPGHVRFGRCVMVLALVLGCRGGTLLPFGDAGALGSDPPTANSATTGSVPSTQPRPNVLLISLDTTRADRLGAYGYEQANTPALDGLAARGTLFTNAYTSCPLTLPAHATLMTGLQPAEHGVRVNGTARLGDEVTTLAEVLESEGYRTGAFVGAFVLDPKFGLAQGFEVYDADLSGALEQEIPEELSRYRPANVVVDAALAWLGSVAGEQRTASGEQGTGYSEQPFFAWLHLYDPHYPYHPHPEVSAGRSYDDEIAFMDRQVGRVLAFLEERGLADNTLFVAVADHGEGLGDHGEIEHGHLLNHEVLHIPLIVALPGVVRAGQRVEAVVSMRDLFPTVLDVAGLAAPPTGGRSLAAALAGESLASQASYAETDFPHTMYRWSPQRSLTTGEWKYVRTARPELYDRRRDVGEVFNLASPRPEQVAALEQELSALEAQFRAPAAAAAVELSAADRERLEALGYGGDASAPPAPAAFGSLEDMAGLEDMKDMLPVKRLDTDLRRGVHFGTLVAEQQLAMARELVARSPQTPMFQSRLGAALMDAGQFAQAAAPLEKALRLDPRQPGAHVDLGRVRAQEGKPDEALACYREALRLDPAFAPAHFSIANALADLGQLDSALGHYAEAVRLRPSYTEAHFNMGNVLARRQRPALARAAYEEALRLEPDNALAHYNLANLLAEEGDDAGAIGHYEAALRLHPGDVDARNNLAVALARQGRADDAEAQYREAIRLAPKFARPYYNLANLLAERRDCTGAAAPYDRAAELQPQWWQPLERLAAMLLDCEAVRDTARAVAVAERAAAAAPSEPQALKTLAEAYAAVGRFADAERAAGAAARLARESGLTALVADLDRQAAAYRGQAGGGSV